MRLPINHFLSNHRVNSLISLNHKQFHVFTEPYTELTRVESSLVLVPASGTRTRVLVPVKPVKPAVTPSPGKKIYTVYILFMPVNKKNK